MMCCYQSWIYSWSVMLGDAEFVLFLFCSLVQFAIQPLIRLIVCENQEIQKDECVACMNLSSTCVQLLLQYNPKLNKCCCVPNFRCSNCKSNLLGTSFLWIMALCADHYFKVAIVIVNIVLHSWSSEKLIALCLWFLNPKALTWIL